MRRRWKLVGGAGLVAGLAASIMLGNSRVSRGDTASSTPPDPTAASATIPANYQDPFVPWPLGPGAIAYSELAPNDQAGVDQILQTEDLSQPASSFNAWADAAAASAVSTQAEIAARTVGLVGTEQDGVTP